MNNKILVEVEYNNEKCDIYNLIEAINKIDHVKGVKQISICKITYEKGKPKNICRDMLED